MVVIRREVRSLGTGWNPTLLWYAKAVKAMRARPTTDKTSWNFLGAMHGFNQPIWTSFGFISAATPLPPAAVRTRYWDQCQHQSWYFLPWHRGYLASFEWIVRATIVGLGGPADWALPYWDYSSTTIADARRIPSAFSDAKMPDGSANPLFTTRRFGVGTPRIQLDAPTVALTAMTEKKFTGDVSDIPPGFGGPITTFNHFGRAARNTNGGLESQPHNGVHGAIGSATNPNDPLTWGLMTNPDTAALDPIFWLHHCNIDRLWTKWLRMAGHSNSLDLRWRSGPADRTFIAPKADGSDWTFIPLDVINTSKAPLEYRYDDQPALPGALVEPEDAEPALEAAMTEPPTNPELIGSSEGAVEVGAGTKAGVTLDQAGTEKVRASFAAAASLAENAPPADEVYLKLEGIRSSSDAAVYHVYIDLPEGADPAEHSDHLAGTVSLFGVSAMSDPDGEHAGNGVNQVFNITEVISRLGLSEANVEKLDVHFAPVGDPSQNARFSVDRISIYRLGK